MEISSLLGDILIKKDYTELKTSELSTKPGAVIGLYYSAHWCPPCRGFTPKLSSVYEEIKNDENKDFEVVFISSDSSEDEFKTYLNEMPWLAIPFDNDKVKDTCSEKFDVSGLPTLVLLNAEDGEVISTDGRSVIEEFGSTGFPFNETKLQECREEKKIKKQNVLAEMGSLSFMGPLVTIDENEITLDPETITNSCETLAIAFLFEDNDHGSSVVIKKLVDVQKDLGKERLGLMVIPLQDLEELQSESKDKMAGIPVVKSGEKAKEVIKRFEPICSTIEPPHVIVLKRDEKGSLKLCSEDAARNIYFTGAEGFPWSSEALDALKAKEAALKEELKARQKNLEFLSKEGKSLVQDKNGGYITLSKLQSNDVVGLYFSAHWCGPCRSFTPKLSKMYNDCKNQNKNFEVVFVSSDSNEVEFKEYYAEMPWSALSFDERNLKSALSEMFEVQGIPTLVLLTGKGEMIKDDASDIVSYGAEYFPWDDASVEKAKEIEAKKKLEKMKEAKEAEEKVALEQEKLGKIVLRRHIGNPSNVTIHVDHTVEFREFSTIVASSAVIPKGKKVFYEVTFKGYEETSRPVSQIGWAMEGFESSDEYGGDGVGDCKYSYGYDGQRQFKWHSGSDDWGKEFDPEDGTVLDVAADLTKGELQYGLNGDWNKPMGIAFDGIDTDIKLFPALTASDLKMGVNFGDNDFKYGPPDSSFVALKEAYTFPGSRDHYPLL